MKSGEYQPKSEIRTNQIKLTTDWRFGNNFQTVLLVVIWMLGICGSVEEILKICSENLFFNQMCQYANESIPVRRSRRRRVRSSRAGETAPRAEPWLRSSRQRSTGTSGRRGRPPAPVYSGIYPREPWWGRRRLPPPWSERRSRAEDGPSWSSWRVLPSRWTGQRPRSSLPHPLCCLLHQSCNELKLIYIKSKLLFRVD